MCLRHVMSDQALAMRRLSLGVFQGLKSVYHPHELPPCVQPGGAINWNAPLLWVTAYLDSPQAAKPAR